MSLAPAFTVHRVPALLPVSLSVPPPRSTAVVTLGRNSPYRHQRHNRLLPRLSLPHIFLSPPLENRSYGGYPAPRPEDSLPTHPPRVQWQECSGGTPFSRPHPALPRSDGHCADRSCDRLVLRLSVEQRGEDERDRQERRAGLCAARLELGSTGRAGDKNVVREVSTERNTWGLTWRQEVETRVSRWRSKLVKYMGKQWVLRTIT